MVLLFPKNPIISNYKPLWTIISNYQPYKNKYWPYHSPLQKPLFYPHLIVIQSFKVTFPRHVPRQYLESYNRKAYVRPPTAWKTAKHWQMDQYREAVLLIFEVFFWGVSIQSTPIAGWFTMENPIWIWMMNRGYLCWNPFMSHSCHLVSKNDRWGDIWTHPLIPTLDSPNAKSGAFAGSWDTCRPGGSLVCPKMGKLHRNTPNGNLDRKNDNKPWNLDQFGVQMV